MLVFIEHRVSDSFMLYLIESSNNPMGWELVLPAFHFWDEKTGLRKVKHLDEGHLASEQQSQTMNLKSLCS